MNTQMVYRQGDILIRKIEKLPDNLTPAKRDNGKLVLAYGEITGHSHAIEDIEAKGWLSGEALYLDLDRRTKIWHDDHNPKKKNTPLILDPGVYEVIRQVEYRRKELVKVVD